MHDILLVEDDEMIRRMINMRLQLRGYQIDLATNGEEGVEKAQGKNYDLVLMDMHMPVMDGHQATATLRKLGYPGMIVAVTASAMSADSDKAIRSGCDCCITKPIGEDFEDRIAELLAESAKGGS